MNTVGQKRWEFSARDGEGRPFSGVVEAETKEEARNILVGRQLMPISIESEKSAQAFYFRRRAQPDGVPLTVEGGGSGESPC